MSIRNLIRALTARTVRPAHSPRNPTVASVGHWQDLNLNSRQPWPVSETIR